MQEKRVFMHQPFLLAKHIKYQEGSVFSKEIISKAAGTVTLFSDVNPFDKLVGVCRWCSRTLSLAVILVTT